MTKATMVSIALDPSTENPLKEKKYSVTFRPTAEIISKINAYRIRRTHKAYLATRRTTSVHGA